MSIHTLSSKVPHVRALFTSLLQLKLSSVCAIAFDILAYTG